jgi:hypothetical protein
LLLICLSGCGEDVEPEPPEIAEKYAEAPELGDDEEEAPEVAPGNIAPRIDWVSFEPEEPAAGDTVRAAVEVSKSECC